MDLIDSFETDNGLDGKKTVHTIALDDSHYVDVSVNRSGLVYLMQGEDGSRVYDPATGKGYSAFPVDEKEVFRFCRECDIVDDKFMRKYLADTEKLDRFVDSVSEEIKTMKLVDTLTKSDGTKFYVIGLDEVNEVYVDADRTGGAVISDNGGKGMVHNSLTNRYDKEYPVDGKMVFSFCYRNGFVDKAFMKGFMDDYNSKPRTVDQMLANVFAGTGNVVIGKEKGDRSPFLNDDRYVYRHTVLINFGKNRVLNESIWHKNTLESFVETFDRQVRKPLDICDFDNDSIASVNDLVKKRGIRSNKQVYEAWKAVTGLYGKMCNYIEREKAFANKVSLRKPPKEKTQLGKTDEGIVM